MLKIKELGDRNNETGKLSVAGYQISTLFEFQIVIVAPSIKKILINYQVSKVGIKCSVRIFTVFDYLLPESSFYFHTVFS